MKQGVISVIIPCYNVSQYVKRCVDSVLNNTYRDLQVICVNDGSTDNTLEILESYTDERMEIISQKNQGLSISRNVGMEKAYGEFICFVDSDDWIHREYFQQLIETQKNTQADVVYCKYTIVHDYCADAELPSANISKKRLFDAFDGSVLGDVAWCKLYKSELIGNTRFVNVFSEDKLFAATLLLSHKDALCAVVDSVLYYYFLRQESAIHSYHEDRILPLSKEFLKLSNQTDIPEVFNLCVETSLKMALSTRYMTMFRDNLSSYNKSCDIHLRDVLKKMHGLPLSKRILYSLFVYIPSTYRFFRRMTDPSLADWEKKEKAINNKK